MTVDDLTLWAALVGLALPALVAFLQKESFGSMINAAIFGAACFIAAAITELVRNGTDFSARGYFHTFLIIVTAAIAYYKLYWKPSTVTTRLRGGSSTGS